VKPFKEPLNNELRKLPTSMQQLHRFPISQLPAARNEKMEKSDLRSPRRIAQEVTRARGFDIRKHARHLSVSPGKKIDQQTKIDEDCNKLTSVPRSARGLRGSEPLNRSRSDLNIIVSALCRQSAGLCYRKRRNSQCGSSSYVGPLSHQPRSHERGCFSARGPVIGRPPRMKAR